MNIYHIEKKIMLQKLTVITKAIEIKYYFVSEKYRKIM